MRSLREVDPHQVLFGRLNSLANGLGNFLRLARAIADDGRAGISHHHQGREGEVLAALDHFGHAVDGDHLVFQLVRIRIKLLNHSWHSLNSHFPIRGS